VPRCRCCVLPSCEPDVRLDAGGLCNFCADWDRSRATVDRGAPLLETDLLKILRRHKGKRRYDCMVMVSGGKDSVAALYYMAERFNCRVLAYTFDQGFGNAQGLENVRRAVDALGVDWIYSRSGFMKDLFAEVVRQRAPAPICPLCSLWYMRAVYDLAQRMDIRLLVTGWTNGQRSGAGGSKAGEQREEEFPSLTQATRDFVEALRAKYPHYRDFPMSMAEVRKGHPKVEILSPHWFLPYHVDDYRDLVVEKLGWRPVDGSWPPGSVNCELNFLAAWLSMKDHGFTHHHIEEAQRVRLGEVTRDEALHLLNIDIHDPATHASVDRVLDKLGCSWSDLGDLEQPWMA
jgi:hypothetical protein